MTYIASSKIASLFDSTTSQALNGDLSRFETVSGADCFFNTSKIHSHGRKLIHICTQLTNDSDGVNAMASVSIKSDVNRIGALLAHKSNYDGTSSTFLGQVNSIMELTSSSNDAGDTIAIAALNFLTISIKD